MIDQPIHYSEFTRACILSDRMGKVARVAVLAKPATTDRAADSAWRRLCVEWGIDTSPLKTSTDVAAYHQARRRDIRIQELEKRLKDSEADMSKLRTELAQARMALARYEAK